MNIIKILLYPIQLLFEGLIYFYKFCISPLLPHACIYLPTCSTYTYEAIERFGILKGIYLGFKRILRCHPYYKGDLYDPVPNKFHW